jgi:translation initiation factor 2 beta subunit (eIF-2beta)/eIF-5
MVVASSSHPIASVSSVPINPLAGAAERYTMPQLLAVRTGRGKSTTTTLPNVDAVAAALERPPLYLVRHFQYSLSIQVGAGAQLSGNVDTARLESLLREFINTWVLCQSSQCRLPECELVVEARSSPILLYCAACGHVAELQRGALTKQSKLVKYIRANPPTMGLGGTRPISGGHRAPSQQPQGQHRQRSGRPVMVQLQTEGAFESHCRRLGRWIAIDPSQDSRAGQTWLNCSAAPTARASTSSEYLSEHDLPGELLTSVFRRLSAKDRYRCMQCCVGWLVGGIRAMEDGRRERREAVAEGTIVESSSDESDPTDSSSSSDSESDIDKQPSMGELDASIDVSDAAQRQHAPDDD